MDLEEELLKSMEKEHLEEQIKEKIDSFHGFLTRDVAIRMIAKQNGLLKEKTYRVAGIPKGEKKLSVTARVRKVWPVASYASGKRSRVVELEDESGTVPLILWDGDTEIAQGLRANDEVTVKGAYERGGEIHLGYSGSVQLVKKSGFSGLSSIQEGVAHLRGVVSRISASADPPAFAVSDGKNEKDCVIVEGRNRIVRMAIGDEVIIENATVSGGRIEIGEDSRILTRRSRDMLLGEVKKIDCREEELLVEIGGREITLDRENALRFLEVEIAPDISLSTVAELKKEQILNKQRAVRIEEREGKTIIKQGS